METDGISLQKQQQQNGSNDSGHLDFSCHLSSSSKSRAFNWTKRPGQGGRLRQDDSTYNYFSLWGGGLGQDDSTYNSLWRSSIQILLWETKPVLLNVIWFIVLNVIGFIVIWFINHPFSTYRRLLGRCHPSFKRKWPFWKGKQSKCTELFWFDT